MIKTTLVAFLLFAAPLIYAQESITVSGGEATGSGGTVSYSVGQLVFTTNTSSDGSVAQGVQQSIELFAVTNLEFTALTLSAVTYPNPTTDYVVLALKNSNLTGLIYNMYDLQGRSVAKGAIEQEATQIEMKDLPPGTYLLQVSQSKREFKTFKIIKN